MKNILFFLVVLCFVQSCYDPEEWPGEDLPHYEMDEEFRDYFRPANEGSTYIYLDTLNGYLDTMTIVSVGDNIGTNVNDFTGEGYNITYECTRTNDFRVQLRTYPEYSSYRHIYSFGSSGSFNNKDGEMGPNAALEKKDSVVINGTPYYDVLMLNTQDQSYKRIWIAKGIGIIFKEVGGARTQHYFLQSYQLK